MDDLRRIEIFFNEENDEIFPAPAKKKRIFRERYDPLVEENERTIRETYRIPLEMIHNLARLLEPQFKRKTRKSKALTSELVVLVGLKFLATGTDIKTLRDIFHIGFGSAQRAVSEFIRALFKIRQDFIKFPQNQNELLKILSKFFEMAEFPWVIGCVDGTHIPIINLPPSIEAIYVCRKGKKLKFTNFLFISDSFYLGGHSLNCQIFKYFKCHRQFSGYCA